MHPDGVVLNTSDAARDVAAQDHVIEDNPRVLKDITQTRNNFSGE